MPAAATSAFRAALDLLAPTCLEVTVRGPLAGLQSASVATDRVWALPGRPLDLVVEIPGLVVQVLAPATHDDLTLPAKVPFRAKVTMMCGCQIAAGQPWLPGDFEVSADVGPVGQAATTRVKLAFSGQPSLFHHHGFEVTEPGYYEAWITAVQRSTGNTGAALVTFFAPPPS